MELFSPGSFLLTPDDVDIGLPILSADNQAGDALTFLPGLHELPVVVRLLQ